MEEPSSVETKCEIAIKCTDFPQNVLMAERYTKETPPLLHTSRFWGNPGVRQFLLGLYDPGSPLRLLMGKYDVLRTILEVSAWDPSCILIGSDLMLIGSIKIFRGLENGNRQPININMLPINLFRLDETLPAELQRYKHTLAKFIHVAPSPQIGFDYTNTTLRSAYLTIHEGWVEQGETHGQPGIHTPACGSNPLDPDQCISSRGFHSRSLKNLRKGGFSGCFAIFVATNTPESCRVWNCKIRRVESGYNGVGEFGSCEHLRPLLSSKESQVEDPGSCHIEPGAYEYLRPDTWYWVSDRTPFETLPVKERCWRRFVRLVVGNVDTWYETHSTKNPKYPVPSCTKVLRGDKFKGDLTVVQSAGPYLRQ